MNRREMIHKIFLGTGGTVGASFCCSCASKLTPFLHSSDFLLPNDSALQAQESPPAAPSLVPDSSPSSTESETTLSPDTTAADYDEKMRRFDDEHPGDLFVAPAEREMFVSVHAKLKAIMGHIGYGHFNMIDFESALKYARHAPRLQRFTTQELDFIDQLFHRDAREYGFLGPRLVKHLTACIPEREVIKIPYSGHFLFRDISLPIYQQIVKDVGDSVILTSGIRSVTKQLYLFAEKIIEVDYNISRASRSLAPPGYSYHGVGDFDIGKKGLGLANFTSEFSHTREYRKLAELGYIDIRYPSGNPYGVRFEPWHIEGALRT
ncbi:MAG: M15 family metallopeptidase [Zetaproteobacteria bacterium]|nr:M15 family metallopeptidase [Zetaproteobacteria bacterium]